MRKTAVLIVVVMMLMLPVLTWANSASFFDTENAVTYSIKANKKVAEIGETISYTATIKNNGDNTIFINSMYDTLGNYFDWTENENYSGIVLEPGETYSFKGEGVIESTHYFDTRGKDVLYTIDIFFSYSRKARNWNGG